jgi:hypothetical protein
VRNVTYAHDALLVWERRTALWVPPDNLQEELHEEIFTVEGRHQTRIDRNEIGEKTGKTRGQMTLTHLFRSEPGNYARLIASLCRETPLSRIRSPRSMTTKLTK